MVLNGHLKTEKFCICVLMMPTKVVLVQSFDEGLWVGQKQCHSTKQAMARDSQSHHTSKKHFQVMKFSLSNTESSRVNPVIQGVS